MGRLVAAQRRTELGALSMATEHGESSKLAHDDYVTRVAKYIPSEVLAAYVAMQGFAKGITAPSVLHVVVWTVFGLGLICTPIYLTRLASKGQPLVLHISLSTVAFIVWAYAMGGPFELAGWHIPALGSVVLVAFTLVAGLFEPKAA